MPQLRHGRYSHEQRLVVEMIHVAKLQIRYQKVNASPRPGFQAKTLGRNDEFKSFRKMCRRGNLAGVRCGRAEKALHGLARRLWEEARQASGSAGRCRICESRFCSGSLRLRRIGDDAGPGGQHARGRLLPPGPARRDEPRGAFPSKSVLRAFLSRRHQAGKLDEMALAVGVQPDEAVVAGVSAGDHGSAHGNDFAAMQAVPFPLDLDQVLRRVERLRELAPRIPDWADIHHAAVSAAMPIPACAATRCSGGGAGGCRRSRCTRTAPPWLRGATGILSLDQLVFQGAEEALHRRVLCLRTVRGTVRSAGVNAALNSQKLDCAAAGGPGGRVELALRGLPEEESPCPDATEAAAPDSSARSPPGFRAAGRSARSAAAAACRAA